jgi:hypothetical protein
MSKIVLYSGLKTDLLTVSFTKEDGSTMTVKSVGLWRNYLKREAEGKEDPKRLPAVFIEFLPATYTDKGNAAKSQNSSLGVKLHCVFESYKEDDLDLLRFEQAVWQKVHKKQYGNFSQFLRRGDNQDFDHTNIDDLTQEYITNGLDELTNTMVDATATPVINTDVIDPDEQ